MSDHLAPGYERSKGPTKVVFHVKNPDQFIEWLESHSGGSFIPFANQWHRSPIGDDDPVAAMMDPIPKRIMTYNHLAGFEWHILEDTGDLRHKPFLGVGIRFDVYPLYSVGGKVEARCMVRDPAVHRFFEALLQDAATQFPEITQELKQEPLRAKLERQEWIQDEQSKESNEDNLTLRQREVAECLAKDMNDKQIAEALTIAPGTVSKHRQEIKKWWGMTTQDIKAMQMEAKRRGYDKGR